MSVPPTPCRTIERCRICRQTELTEVVSLGDQYVASLFPHGELRGDVDHPYPLEVVRCSSPDGCGLVQLRHTVAPEILYDQYGYRSGTNELMRRNLKGIAAQIEDLIDPQPGDLVVDIGCNDGTLLASYEGDVDLVGIDPSDAVEDITDERIEVIREFFDQDTLVARRASKRARGLTTIAMFYDLDEPARFVSDVARVLAEDGVWVIELQYLPLILEMNAVDTICHEHLEYYALGPIEKLLAGAGLRVFRAEINDVNGGSIRLFVGHRDTPHGTEADAQKLDDLRQEEKRAELDSDVPYAAFRSRCDDVGEDAIPAPDIEDGPFPDLLRHHPTFERPFESER